MNALSLMAFLVSVMVVTTCARAQSQLFTSSKDLRAKVQSEMKAVVLQVTKAHIEGCRAELEKPTWSGAKYQAYGGFRADVLVSCMAQTAGVNFFSSAPSAKRAAYAVRMKKVAGAYGTGSPQDLGVCVFELQNGKIKFLGAQRTPKIARNHECIKLSR